MTKRGSESGWASVLAALGLTRSFHKFGAEPSILAALFLVLALIALAAAFGDPIAFAVAFPALAAYLIYQVARFSSDVPLNERRRSNSTVVSWKAGP